MYPIAPYTGGTPLEPWMTLAIKNRHPRDNNIHFDEPTHIYTVNGTSRHFVSVTGLHHHLFSEFDSDRVIRNMMNKPNWPENKWYYLKTAEAIKAKWRENGREASEAGTAMHLGIEMVMNGAEAIVDPAVKASKEWEYFWNYWKKDSLIWEPWRSEWDVYDEELKISGQIDMVYRNKHDGTFAIYDWKRTNKMEMDNKYQKGLGPVSHLPDTNYWHYTIQLNLYRWILEKHYGLKISELALIVLHPTNKNYKIYKLNRLEEEIEEILEARRRAVKEGKGKIYIFNETAPASTAVEQMEEEEESEPLPKMCMLSDD